MVLKRKNGALIQVNGSGVVLFKPKKFTRALGEVRAGEYRRALERLAHKEMKNPVPKLPVDEARDIAPELSELVRRTLEEAEKSDDGTVSQSST